MTKQINSYDEYHANRLKGLEDAVAENRKGEKQEQPPIDNVASDRVKVIAGQYVGEEGEVRASSEDGTFLYVLLGPTLHWIPLSDCERLKGTP